jgi:hypothetical protein
MKVRLKEGAAPITFGAYSAPSHPEYFNVPANYTTGALRALEAGQLEYAPREAAALPPVPVAAKIDRRGFAARKPARG